MVSGEWCVVSGERWVGSHLGVGPHVVPVLTRHHNEYSEHGVRRVVEVGARHLVRVRVRVRNRAGVGVRVGLRVGIGVGVGVGVRARARVGVGVRVRARCRS